MYNPIIEQPDKCYGCGACVIACPKSCLKLAKDELGFKKISFIKKESCIDCGMCSKVCEALHMQKREEDNLKRFYAQSKSTEVLKRSSSGGFFSALANYVFEQGGYVWGVRMTAFGKCEFAYAEDPDALKKLCGSKYVEVDTELPFVDVKQQLKTGRLVLFSGTPCQIQAMKLYLNNIKYENLILVDLLCYGVQSPAMWEKYLAEIEPDHAGILSVQMRYKKPDWENYSMKIDFENGSRYSKSRWRDAYLLSYATNLYNRPICTHCNAKAFPRVSDITIGDFWQIDTLPSIPESINVNLGVSIVLTHGELGFDIVKQLGQYLNIYELPKEVFPNMIERFSGCSKINANKEKFLIQVKQEKFKSAVKSNTESQLYMRLRFKYLKVKRILKRIKNRG